MKIFMVAGGSGGHIYPALSLANELRKRGHNIEFIGASNRMEKEVIPEYGYPFYGLHIATTRGGILQKIKSISSMVFAYWRVKKYLRNNKAEMVIGFGNYISVPVMLAAKKLGLKTILHEQNSFAGRANLFLDQKVDVVIGSYEENRTQFKNPKIYILGNPRSSIAAKQKREETFRQKYGLRNDLPLVTFFFGSLGSESLCQTVCKLLDNHERGYQILYATGKLHYEKAKCHECPNGKIVLSLDGIQAMKASDLLVTRAGATTIAEITASGSASILIPSPYVPNNHQYYNAKTLADKQAAILVEEKDANTAKLEVLINELIMSPKRLQDLRDAALCLANPHVIEEIVEIIEKL